MTPTGPGPGTRPGRIFALRAEIADLERLMVDMPPHHAGGTRQSAAERLEDLRAELRRAERGEQA